jgi:tetratricopeptide (TPR) repeat protein
MKICMNSNIPVIIGTLTSNLKDQKPFISIASEKSSSADDIYEEALFNFRDGYIVKADSLFRNAKDLDGLRFRAPEVFNKIIRKLSGKFNAQIADIDFYLKKASEAGIIGNDLMTDHLHPNVIGYQLMGKLFTEKILQSKLFYHDSVNINIDSIHSQVLSNFHFTKYDSIISDFRIKILKNDWPFIERDKKIAKNELFQIKSIEGEIAQGVLDGNISRLEARIELIEHYTESGEYIPVAEHLLSLVDEFPNQKEILNNYTAKLISLKKYQFTERLLETSYYIEPDAFNTKWLGIMFISNNNFTKAIKFLTESINFNPNDPQIFFNLSGAYFQKKDYLKSYHYINKCLEISPSYRNALSFKLNLEKLLKN